MGQPDDQQKTNETYTAEEVLQAVTQDLKNLQQGLIVQLAQEVARLQAEKARLMADIEQLQTHQKALQTRHMETLSQQQIAQQQLWAKQLAEVLAKHLQALMLHRLNQIVTTHPSEPGSTSTDLSAPLNGYSENAQRLLASLDSTFNTTFKTLQQELGSYQSNLSQQINRMHSLEQQGEAILETLVSRLREQLQMEAARRPPAPPPPPSPTAGNGHTAPSINSPPYQSRTPYPPPAPAPVPIPVPGTPLPLPSKPKREISNFQLGMLLVLLSTVALSIHNVVVKVIGNSSTVMGISEVGGFLKLGFGNSLLILWLRMLVVLPLMIPVAMFLYPPVWRDIRKFLSSHDRRPILNVVGSGFFLFLSQILIYTAIPQIGAGPAITILFMYPIVTVPLAWILFGDRPTRLRWIVMGTILVGVILTAVFAPLVASEGMVKAVESTASAAVDPGSATSTSVIKGNGVLTAIRGNGVLTAIGSGISFAFYLIFMQLGFKKLHPVPVSLVQFSTIFVLSSVLLILFGSTLGVKVDNTSGFIWGGIVLGTLTLIGYLANNFGVRFMGAARASIIASSGPAATAILALLLIRNQLQAIQWLGIVLVTVGVAALSFERMQTQPAAPTKPSK
jgi:drug/metabolite transporter (DMT)-like permease